MNTTASIAAICFLASLSGIAAAHKPCEELKQEIAAKLDTKGVQHYQLQVVASTAPDARKTAGSCDGGTQRIVYQREPAQTALAKR
ncbi:MAG: DUF1161 domain-containing protein [Tahibacter sp.]